MAGTKAPRRKASPPKTKSNGKPPETAAPAIPGQIDGPVTAPLAVLAMHTHGESESSRYYSQLDDKFPRWREVIPDLEGYVTEFVDWRFLKEAAALLGKMLGVDQRAISISLSPEKPVLVSGHNRETGVRGCIIIMPMECDGQERKPHYVPKGETKAKS